MYRSTPLDWSKCFLPTSTGSTLGRYKFEFLHNEFIGNVKTAVYDVVTGEAWLFSRPVLD
jgi:hypothetical protein